MRSSLLAFLLSLSLFSVAQNIYDPQLLYDAPGGLYDETVLRDLHITFLSPNYHTILAGSFFNDPSYRLMATVELDGTVLDSVGVRYKGNSTFCLPNDQGNPKVPYNIDMNYWVSGQKLMGYKKLKLANAWLDPTFVKEYSGAEIYRRYLPTPEVSPINLHVQGNNMGMYVNTESVNKQFLQKHFGEKDGTLFKCDPAQVFCNDTTTANGEPSLTWLGADSSLYYSSYIAKSDHGGWNDLLELINTIENDPSQIDSVLNVDRTLWYMATTSVISNLDAYNGKYVHNYYLYKTEDDLFQMIPWDLSESFVGALMGWEYFNPAGLYEWDPWYAPAGRPLLTLLMNDPDHRKRYTAHLRTVISESLDAAAIDGSITQVQNLIGPSVNLDPNKPFSMQEFNDNVDSAFFAWPALWGWAGIISTVNEREQYLNSLTEITQTTPVISSVSLNGSNVEASVSGASAVELMATISSYSSKFQSFSMLDDGLNADLLAGDGIYTAPLPFVNSGAEVKFYVKAEDNNALSLSPERAEYEFYTADAAVGVYSPNPLIVSKKLLRVTDVLGRLSQASSDQVLLYWYSDGSVEKRISLGQAR